MTITAQQVITAARDEHAAFSVARTTNLMLLRHLEQYHKVLAQLITDVNASVLSVEDIIDLTTFDFDVGDAFPAHVYVLPDGEVSHPTDRNRSDRSKFTILGQNVRLDSRPLISGWFVQNRLFLQGDAQDWTNTTNLYLSYVAVPTGPTALADNFDPIPDSAFPVLVTRCSRMMAKRGHTEATLPPIDIQAFAGDFATAEARFLAEMGARKKARTVNTLDVFPAG